MNSFKITFSKLNTIKSYAYVKTDDDFPMIMERLLYKNPIEFRYEHPGARMVASNFTIFTADTRDVVYEFDLLKLKPGEITLSFEKMDMALAGFELMHIMDRHNEIDILDFAKYCRKKVGNADAELAEAIFGGENKKTAKRLRMYLNDKIMRIECYSKEKEEPEVRDREVQEKQTQVILFPLEHRPSFLKGIVLYDTLEIPAHGKVFWKVIQELENRNVPYEVLTERNNIPGHDIDVENLGIRGEDFLLLFDRQRFLQAYFGATAAESSYFTTTKGAKHNIAEIVRKELKKEKSVQVEGYGADDAWHYAYNKKQEYVYALGYCL